MTLTRRRFLQVSGVTVGGLIVYGSLPATLWLRGDAQAASDPLVPTGYQPEMHQWAMIIDIEKCIGCRRCLNACKQENHVPDDEGLNRTWLERYQLAEDGSLKATFISHTGLVSDVSDNGSEHGFFVPKLCNQCANPPCVAVCPVNATFTAADGAILVDKERCVGCKYCIVACPYGARFLHPETKVVDKCTFCYHRITQGMAPACVEACPTGARSFGDLKNPDDAVRRRLLDEALQVSRPSLGTRPRVFYKGLIVVNAAHWDGGIMFYTPTMATANIFLSLLVAGLMAAGGVLISLRSATVQGATQALMIVMMAPIILVQIGAAITLSVGGEALRGVRDSLGTVNVPMTMLIGGLVLAVLCTGLTLAAMARLRRARLILD